MSSEQKISDKHSSDSVDENMSCCGRSKFAIFVILLQALFLGLYAGFGTYDYEDTGVPKTWFYPMFQNVHVMMFIGFGFLMTFLRRYAFSAISVNFLIAAMVIQWHMLFKGLMSLGHHAELTGSYSIPISMLTLISADFTAAAVLISFGAVIGKTSPLQLLLMGFFEVMIFSTNEYIAVEVFQATDVGGSMVVHIFGAYFGLAVSRVIYKPNHSQSNCEGSNYNSDLFSMIGTIFLWMYWPSFNSAVAGSEHQQLRAVINTYLALASCVLITFAVSSLTDHRARFNMVHVQNATLAGGVAVGTAANFMIDPWGAILIGIIAAVLSVLGYTYLQPALLSKIGLHDSCGVNNLHGMPGLLAAVIGAISVAFANVDTYGTELYEVFPAMASVFNESTNTTTVGRSAHEQAGYQAATFVVTFIIAIVGGLLTGLFLRFVPGLDAPEPEHLYTDEKHFETPDDFEITYNEVNKQEMTTVLSS